MEEPPVKTAKQLEKEAKKLAKLEKFKQKQDQKQNTPKEEVCSLVVICTHCYSCNKYTIIYVNKGLDKCYVFTNIGFIG